MTARISAELRKSFFEVSRLSDVLHRDTQIAMDEMIRLVQDYNRRLAPGEDVIFWVKITIRSFMAQVDGLGYAMRRAVLQNSAKSGLPLTTKERARLSEKKYETATDTILDKPAYLSTEDGIKLAFRYFPQLFGANRALDTSGEEWRGFMRVSTVRNNLTHPKILEHLTPLNALPALWPTLSWFYAQLLGLFTDIFSRIGVASLPGYPIENLPKFREVDSPRYRFFDDETHRIVKESGGKTLQYINKMFELMRDDLLRGYDVCRGSFDSLKDFKGPRSQFAFRTLLRLVFSDIEGYINITRFQLDAAVARGTVQLTEEEHLSLIEGELEDRLASSMMLWAREFGNGMIPQREGATWVRLRAARELRNRITHPKSVDSLEITLKQTDTVLGANDYLMENIDAFSLDEEKWTIKGGSVFDALNDLPSDDDPDLSDIV